MATATTMYHTGKNPLKRVTHHSDSMPTVKGLSQRRLHKAFLRYHDPANWPMLREALKTMGREDLIGNGKDQLIPSYQPRDGDNDTSVTGWMVFAMKSAEEGKLKIDRQAYNDSVMRYNNACEQFPGSVIANMSGFKMAEFFEVEDEDDEPEPPEEVEEVFKQKPALHRFPGSMGKRAHAVCVHLVEHYDVGRLAPPIRTEVTTGGDPLAVDTDECGGKR